MAENHVCVGRVYLAPLEHLQSNRGVDGALFGLGQRLVSRLSRKWRHTISILANSFDPWTNQRIETLAHLRYRGCKSADIECKRPVESADHQAQSIKQIARSFRQVRCKLSPSR